MDDNNTLNHASHTEQKPERLTIALFTYGLMDTIGEAVWLGMEDVAREHDVNLICCSGGSWQVSPGVVEPANALYDMTAAERVDGLVIWAGVLHSVDTETAHAFCRRYAPLPVVTLGLQVEGIPAVLADNYTGMYSVVEHLAAVHGYRRIAFVRGPEGHEEAEDRYRAYRDVLAAHSLELDLALVAPGNNQHAAGVEAVELLCDTRHLRPQDDFDAVVAANDNMAFGVLETLQARGIRVPDDVAVVGFDDFEEDRHSSPPLTSVPWPGYAQGRQAAELLLALLEHASAPAVTHVPTELVIRESCGCVIPAVQQAGTASLDVSAEASFAALSAERDAALDELAQAMQDVGTQSLTLDLATLAELWDLFLIALDPASNGNCLPRLLTLVRRTTDAGVDANVWHTAFSLLRRRALAYAASGDMRSRLESHCHQARVMISYEVQRTLARGAWWADNQADHLRVVEQALMVASDLDHFAGVLVQQFPTLDIPGCAVVLYEDAEQPLSARVLAAYDGHQRVEQATPLFTAQMLLPETLWPYDRRFSLVLEALRVRQERLGYVLFEVGPRDGDLYGALRDQLSSALHVVRLIEDNRRAQASLEQSYTAVEQQVQARTAELQREIASREMLYERRALQVQTSTQISQEIAAVPALDELYRLVVTLIKERFDYYHAQIFRHDLEINAVRLITGYGEVGAKMLAEGHQIEMGIGVVGTAAETGQPVLATDVTQDRDWRPNPNLPETQGELAVPIRLREEVFGILDVQSDRAGALTLDDQLLLQQLCGQIAIAIENTRLREEMEGRLETLNLLQQSMSREGWEALREQRRGLQGYMYDHGAVQPLMQPPEAGREVYVVPVAVQQEVVGQLAVQADPAHPLSEEERMLLDAIAEQVASALDRARLFEDTRRSAARDQIIGELSAQMRTSLDIDQVLQNAVRDMVSTLNFARVEVRLSGADLEEAATEEVNV
ncbi:MAG: substrate-binding domain-containing protein [Anaerolineae bacterium]|nr:substrate-binding domain-containing protein [Anaerolineae bacterium]